MRKLYKTTTLNHQICVVWGRELFTFPFETKRLLHILCWRWGMAPLEAVIKYTLWRNSEENKNCFFSNVVEPLKKVMIRSCNMQIPCQKQFPRYPKCFPKTQMQQQLSVSGFFISSVFLWLLFSCVSFW